MARDHICELCDSITRVCDSVTRVCETPKVIRPVIVTCNAKQETIMNPFDRHLPLFSLTVITTEYPSGGQWVKVTLYVYILLIPWV